MIVSTLNFKQSLLKCFKKTQNFVKNKFVISSNLLTYYPFIFN
jgi:hypothetical protein